MEIFIHILQTVYSILWDITPILLIIFGFQFFIIRQPIPNLKRVLLGIVYVLIGLSIFLVGLERALFPLGKVMANQLTDPNFLRGNLQTVETALSWYDYYWVYIFAFAIGLATTIAEPSLMAVAIKAREVSGGAIGVWGLRISVAIGAAIGISLGSFRIITGTPLHYFIIAGYIFVIIQTYFAPRVIIGLAYDSGGVTTSTVTVPVVAALGLGLASNVPGRSAILDGFGLIAFTCLFPMITVMGYAQFAEWKAKRRHTSETKQQQQKELSTTDSSKGD